MSNHALCIPGFLGTERDFDFLTVSKSVVPLFQGQNDSAIKLDANLDTFGERLTAYAQQTGIFSNTSLHSVTGIGYSLGGRLLMHAAIQNPSYFKNLVIISAHTGLESKTEKSLRLQADSNWSERFLSQPWDKVITAWNEQAALKSDSPPPIRTEADYNKAMLAHALTAWSLGNQENLTTAINLLPQKLLWIVGDQDLKFKAIAQELAKKAANIQLEIIPNAGHRVMWEKPSVVDTLVRNYVEKN